MTGIRSTPSVGTTILGAAYLDAVQEESRRNVARQRRLAAEAERATLAALSRRCATAIAALAAREVPKEAADQHLPRPTERGFSEGASLRPVRTSRGR